MGLDALTVVHMDTSKRPKKRLIVELDRADYALLKRKADARQMTVANHVRQALGLPLERQGVKRILEPVIRGRAKTAMG